MVADDPRVGGILPVCCAHLRWDRSNVQVLAAERAGCRMTDMPDLTGVPVRLNNPVFRYHEYQGDTNDCGPTSVAIAVNALLNRRALAGPVVAKEMSHLAFEWRPWPRPLILRIPNGATFPWGIVHYLRKKGFRARWRAWGTLERLEQNLKNDRMTMVVTGDLWRWENWRYRGWAHIKLLFGLVPGRGLIFVDPGQQRSSRSDRLEHHGLFWQDEETFLRQWRNMFQVFVEVEERTADST